MIFVSFESTSGIVKDAFADYEMILSSHIVSPPKPKLYQIDIEGSDGILDLSEWAGEIKYESRPIKLVFTCIADRSVHKDILDRFTNFVCGRVMKITFSDEPQFYYQGRCDSISVETEKGISEIEMTFVCDAYKMAHELTVIEKTVATSVSLYLMVKRKTVLPTFEISNANTVTLAYDGATINTNNGTRQFANIIVTDVPKLLTITGASKVKISWREGVL